MSNFGIDLLLESQKAKIKSNNDILVIIVHWLLCKNNLRNVGVGDNVSLILFTNLRDFIKDFVIFHNIIEIPTFVCNCLNFKIFCSILFRKFSVKKIEQASFCLKDGIKIQQTTHCVMQSTSRFLSSTHLSQMILCSSICW